MSADTLTRRVRELSEWPPPHLTDSEVGALVVSAHGKASARCPECGADVHGYTCPFCSEGDA